MKMKTVIVDDEFPAIQLIRSYCQKIDDIEVVESFTKAEASLYYLQNHTVDLLLLDIQMPLINGIEVLKKLNEKPICIFITANPEYALNAFELEVIDYLLKPVSFKRFEKAIEKAIEYHQYKKTMAKVSEKKFLMVKADYKITKISIDDILWIEGSGEYIKIIAVEKTFLILDSLTNYIENLLPNGFVRIHKSYIMPVSKIVHFSSTTVTHQNQKEFTIGRSYKNDAMKILKKEN